MDVSRFAALSLLLASAILTVTSAGMLVGGWGVGPVASLAACAAWTGYLGGLMVSAAGPLLQPAPVPSNGRSAAHRR